MPKRAGLVRGGVLAVGFVALAGCGAGARGRPAVVASHRPAEDLASSVDKCRGGDGRACNRAASMYEWGYGAPQDFARAAPLYRTACEQAHAQGCNNLGWLFLLGHGVPHDFRTAMALFLRAYDGYRGACLRGERDGCILAAGQLLEQSIEPDDGMSFEAYLQRACDLGDGSSCQQAAAAD